jgi:hypothetical protein
MQCLFATKGDIDEATKLYEYFAKDIPELPDYDPVQPTWIDKTGDVANGIVNWIGNNKDALAQGYEIIRSITGNRLPPLMGGIDTPPAPTTEPLPPINK